MVSYYISQFLDVKKHYLKNIAFKKPTNLNNNSFC